MSPPSCQSNITHKMGRYSHAKNFFFLMFPLSIDHILTHLGPSPFPQPNTCCVRAYALVVEPSSVRGLAADHPLKKSRGFNLALIQLIFSIFITFTLVHISSLRCSLIVFRVFQQLNEYFFILISQYGIQFRILA